MPLVLLDVSTLQRYRTNLAAVASFSEQRDTLSKLSVKWFVLLTHTQKKKCHSCESKTEKEMRKVLVTGSEKSASG